MKLRNQALLIFASTFIPLIVFFYLSIRQIVLMEHETLEYQTVQQNIRRTQNTIKSVLESLDTLNLDWSEWDDTYAYIADTNETYVAENLGESSFISLKLDFLAFVNSAGDFVGAYHYSAEEETIGPLQPRLKDVLTELIRRHIQPYPDQRLSGFLTADVPYLISIQPIRRTDGAGPSRGWLVMGRAFTEERIAEVRQITDVDTIFAPLHYPTDDPNQMWVPDVYRQLTESSASTYLVHNADRDTVHGYALIHDLYQKPIFVLRITMPRAIYRQGLSSLNYVAMALLSMGLVFGLMILYLWQKHILSRLTQLSENVEGIRTMGDISQRIPVEGNDELTSVEQAINRMLRAMEHATDALRESEFRYRSFARNFQGIAFRTDIQFNPVFIHGAVEPIIGFSEREIIANRVRLLQVLHPEDAKRLAGDLQALQTVSGFSREWDIRLVRKDNEIRWAHVLIQNVPDEKGHPLYIQGAIYDVTLHHDAETALERSRDEFSRLTAHLQSIREDESTRIARQIHDDLGQLLVALKIQASSLAKKVAEGKAVADQARQITRLVDSIADSVRRIALRLKPSVLDTLSLPEALDWQVKEFHKHTGLPVNLTIDPPDLNVDRDLATAVFRICQESLTNIARHAHATEGSIMLTWKDSILTLTIRDNGRGIPPEKIQDLNSFGLLQIRERAGYYGGTVTFGGKPGAGTTVEISIPLPTEMIKMEAL